MIKLNKIIHNLQGDFMERKCTACGGGRLRLVEGLVYEGDMSDGNAKLRGEAFVCLHCGHIEIYSTELLKQAKEQEAKIKRKQKLYDELDEELRQKEMQIKESKDKVLELQKTIKELTKKVSDEDISFREHKKAEEDLNEANKKLDQENNIIVQCRYFIDHVYNEIKNRIREKGYR